MMGLNIVPLMVLLSRSVSTNLSDEKWMRKSMSCVELACATRSECTDSGETEWEIHLFLSFVFFFKICGVYIVNLSVTNIICLKKKKITRHVPTLICG